MTDAFRFLMQAYYELVDYEMVESENAVICLPSLFLRRLLGEALSTRARKVKRLFDHSSHEREKAEVFPACRITVLVSLCTLSVHFVCAFVCARCLCPLVASIASIRDDSIGLLLMPMMPSGYASKLKAEVSMQEHRSTGASSRLRGDIERHASLEAGWLIP